MKKSLYILLGVFIWLALTAYFVSLHTVESKEAEINKTVKLDNITIELERLILYNAERQAIHPLEESQLKYDLVNKLPWKLASFYLRLDYLYSKPYEINNELLHTSLQGSCFFSQEMTDSEEYLDYFNEYVEIELVDSSGVHYSRGRNASHEGGSRKLDFAVRGEDFPLERLAKGFTIIVKDKLSGQEKILTVPAENFQAHQYNDAFGSRIPFSVH